MANDDPILTTMRFIPQHEVVQKYGVILPDYLTNPTMKESEAYKTYHDLATGKEKDSKQQLRQQRTGVKPGVLDVPTYDSKDEQISWKSSSDDIDDDDHDDDADNDRERHDDEEDKDEEDKDEETFDPRVQTPSHYETSDDKAYIEVAQGANAEEEKMEEEKKNKEDEATDMYRDVNINLEGRDTEMTDTPYPIVQTTQVIEDTYLTLTPVNPEGQQQSSSMSSGFISNMFNPNPDTDKIRDEAQAENEDFLNKIDDNIKELITEQVKAHVKKQVSKILPMIEKFSSTKWRGTNLLIDQFHKKNLYKALVDAYEADKDLLESYVDVVTIKRHREDVDDDEEPPAGSDRGSKRRRAGKEPESTSVPKEKASKTTGKSTKGTKPRHKSASQYVQRNQYRWPTMWKNPHIRNKLPPPGRDWNKTLPTIYGPIQPWLSTLSQKEDPHESFNELMDTPFDFTAFMMNRLKVYTLTPELLAGPTFELMKGACKSLVEMEYFFEEVYKATTEQLD
ncbi:hypothetical protein Tco_0871467 [Tanacetum coccineum]